MSTQKIPLPDDDIVDPVRKAADELGLGYSTLRSLIAKGEGPKVIHLTAGKHGIRRRDRREWLDARTS